MLFLPREAKSRFPARAKLVIRGAEPKFLLPATCHTGEFQRRTLGCFANMSRKARGTGVPRRLAEGKTNKPTADRLKPGSETEPGLRRGGGGSVWPGP